MNPVVHPHHHKDTGTWSYVVADPSTRVAAVIDPVLDFDAKSASTSTVSAQVLLEIATAHDYDVHWLLETHAHADHLSAAQWFKQRLPHAVLAIGAGIREVQRTFAPRLDPHGAIATDGSQFDVLFADGEEFEVGRLQARTIPVPGHTRDSLAYLIGDALFTGDSLFMPDAGTARCDFPGGDAATLYRSIRRLYEGLPGDTRVFVCHDYARRRLRNHPRRAAAQQHPRPRWRGRERIRNTAQRPRCDTRHAGLDPAFAAGQPARRRLAGTRRQWRAIPADSPRFVVRKP